MKTYEEYLKIIQDREWKEGEAERERARKWQEENPNSVQFTMSDNTRMTFDYSVEIMGMMMKDFLEEFNSLPSKDKYPMEKGSRKMYAILGVGGAIYGFSLGIDKAEETRDKCWNIGKRKPEMYIVNFTKV